jgi:hypothetical protein
MMFSRQTGSEKMLHDEGSTTYCGTVIRERIETVEKLVSIDQEPRQSQFLSDILDYGPLLQYENCDVWISSAKTDNGPFKIHEDSATFRPSWPVCLKSWNGIISVQHNFK